MKFLATALATLVLTQAAHAACVNAAQRPVIVDGSSASLEQMYETQLAVKAFIATGEARLKCFDNVSLYNRQLIRLQRVAEHYNKQLREFRSKDMAS